MLQLIVGLVLFFGMHSVSIVALPLRDRLAARSELGWKAFYGVISLVGLVLMVRGYADLRAAPTPLYQTPAAMRHVAAVLMLPAFTLFLAPYLPGRISAAVKHPQLIAVVLWAVAHLLVNGNESDVILFGAFLVWACADLWSMSRRPVRPVPGAPRSSINDVVLVVVGLALYVAMIYGLHARLFGVPIMT